jgi:hypothetical protein
MGDRLLFYRESGAGVYGPGSYWVSASLPYLPFALGVTALYGTLLYFLTGLRAGACVWCACAF